MIHLYLKRPPLMWAVALFLSLTTSSSGNPDDLQAGWIWAPENQGVEMLLARKSFSLKEIPQSASLRISASSIYKLYVNGEYIRRGPARSAPHHQSYDDFDISRFLKTGKNVMAVRVHYQEGSIAYHHQGRGGLLVQLDLMDKNGRAWTVATDDNWRVLGDPAWSSDSVMLSRFHLEVADRMDMTKAIPDWASLGYDDASWDKAVSLMRKVGWPSVQRNAKPDSLTPPWTRLEKRDLPPLIEELVRPEHEEASSLINLEDVNLGGKSGDDLQLSMFDFGEVVNGVAELEIEGSAGAVAHVLYAPYLVDGKLSPQTIQSVLADQVILSGGTDKWEAMYFKPTRYLGLVIEGSAETVKLKSVAIRTVKYPFQLSGSLATPEDPWFADCWNAAAKTIDVCTTDAYTDNYRERRQYVQTAYYAAIGNYWTFGDSALMRRCLKQAAEEQQANGLMPAYAPRHGDDFMVILDSNTAWFRGLHDYLLYTGDYETVRNLLPAGQKLMQFMLSYTDDQGMFNNPPYSYWLDHANLDRRGANMCMNGHFLGALQDWAELLEWMEEPGAADIAKAAQKLRISLQENLWNEKRGLFCDAWIDGNQSTMFSEHANAMALAAGVATSEQAARIAEQIFKADNHDYINRESGMVMVTPAMAYHLHDGLAKYGYARESLSLFKDRFGFMLEPQYNGTLWEEWFRGGSDRIGRLTRKGRTRSDAQTESAFPPALFGEHILGVKPVKPGCTEVLVSLPDCGMKKMSGGLPTTHGVLAVDWDLESRALEIDVPEGVTVSLNFETKTKHTTLKKGIHRVLF